MKGDRFERLMSRLQNIESSVTNFQTDQMGPKTAKYLLQKAIQVLLSFLFILLIFFVCFCLSSSVMFIFLKYFCLDRSEW